MIRHMTLASIAATLILCIGSASAQAQSDKNRKHASGTLVSLSPMPYSDLKSFVLKTSSDEEKFIVSEAADVPRGLKPGDAVSVDYRVDDNGIRWASTIKKGGIGKGSPSKGKSIPRKP